MVHKVRQFLALNSGQKAILIQGWFMLGWFRAAVLLLPFKRLTAKLRHHPNVGEARELSATQLEEAKQVGYLVTAAASVTPWQSLCLVQVLVVQRLLSKRGIPGEIYLGVNKEEVSELAPNGLAAHAWLNCGDTIVSGEAGYEQYTVLSAFSWGFRDD